MFYTTGMLLPAGDPRDALMEFIQSGKGFVVRIVQPIPLEADNYVKMINGTVVTHGLAEPASLTTSQPTCSCNLGEFMWKVVTNTTTLTPMSFVCSSA